MATKLTKKQRGFVKDYVKTGIGSLAVKENYDVANDNVARNIASENLAKPSIQKAIADMIPDDLLVERHLELLNKREPTGGVDTQAVSKGLDMAYKIKKQYEEGSNGSKSINIIIPLQVSQAFNINGADTKAIGNDIEQEPV